MPTLIDTKPNTVRGRKSVNTKGYVRREFTRVYQVLGDSLTDTETYIIETTGGLPQVGSIVSGAICRSVRADEQETHFWWEGQNRPLWEVTAEFDTDVELQEDDGETPPELLLPEWEWDGEDITTLVENDQVTGDPIENSAGEPTPIEGLDVISVLTVERYEVSFSPTIQQQFQRKTNSQPFYGAPAGCALMAKIRDRKSDRTNLLTGVPYRKVTYVVKFYFRVDEDGELIGWLSRLRDRGTFYEDTDENSNIVRVQFIDEKGTPTTGDLAGNGARNPDGADPIYKNWHKFAEIDFNQLGLGPF